MTTRALVSALRHLPPGESDSATAASEPMCSKSSDCIFRGGTGELPVGVVSSTSSSSASIPRPNFSAPIIGTDPPTAMRNPKLPSSPSPYLFCKKRRAPESAIESLACAGGSGGRCWLWSSASARRGGEGNWDTTGPALRKLLGCFEVGPRPYRAQGARA
jgi:hypothetical protein